MITVAIAAVLIALTMPSTLPLGGSINIETERLKLMTFLMGARNLARTHNECIGVVIVQSGTQYMVNAFPGAGSGVNCPGPVPSPLVPVPVPSPFVGDIGYQLSISPTPIGFTSLGGAQTVNAATGTASATVYNTTTNAASSLVIYPMLGQVREQ